MTRILATGHGGGHAMRFVASVVALSSLSACGGGNEGAPKEEAQDSCYLVVDAFARAWDRCGRRPYPEAYDLFMTAFPCDDVEGADADAVDACLSDVDAIDCAAVQSGATPDSCKRVVE